MNNMEEQQQALCSDSSDDHGDEYRLLTCQGGSDCNCDNQPEEEQECEECEVPEDDECPGNKGCGCGCEND